VDVQEGTVVEHAISPKIAEALTAYKNQNQIYPRQIIIYQEGISSIAFSKRGMDKENELVEEFKLAF